MGYLAQLYHWMMHNPADAAWNGIGFFGQAVFGVRFLIQWLRSEQEGRSVVPIAFWYCSLVGGLISFSYALHIQAWPLLVGQGMPIPIYGRNLYLIYRERASLRAATKPIPGA